MSWGETMIPAFDSSAKDLDDEQKGEQISDLEYLKSRIKRRGNMMPGAGGAVEGRSPNSKRKLIF